MNKRIYNMLLERGIVLESEHFEIALAVARDCCRLVLASQLEEGDSLAIQGAAQAIANAYQE